MPTSNRSFNRGVSLIFALLTLMALSLAALALVRSVDTGALVLGNLGFKQDATASADLATRQAMAFIGATGFDLTQNSADGTGYFASSGDAVDVTGQQQPGNVTRALIDWDDDNCGYASTGTYATCLNSSAPIKINDATTARYVVFRLCASTGTASATNVCAAPASALASSTEGYSSIDYQHMPLAPITGGAYYRIVVRVLGARNTTSFVETVVTQ